MVTHRVYLLHKGVQAFSVVVDEACLVFLLPFVITYVRGHGGIVKAAEA